MSYRPTSDQLAIDRAGKTRKLAAGDVLKDGERLLASLSMMDSASVSTRARAFLGDSFDTAGKTDSEIQREVVRRHLGGAAVEGKGDVYIAAAFDTLVQMSQPTTTRTPQQDHEAAAGARDAAYAEYVRSLNGKSPGQASRVADTATVADARAHAEQAREAMIRGLKDGWRTENTPAPSGVADTAMVTDAESAREAMIKRLNDGWKTPE